MIFLLFSGRSVRIADLIGSIKSFCALNQYDVMFLVESLWRLLLLIVCELFCCVHLLLDLKWIYDELLMSNECSDSNCELDWIYEMFSSFGSIWCCAFSFESLSFWFLLLLIDCEFFCCVHLKQNCAGFELKLKVSQTDKWFDLSLWWTWLGLDFIVQFYSSTAGEFSTA